MQSNWQPAIRRIDPIVTAIAIALAAVLGCAVDEPDQIRPQPAQIAQQRGPEDQPTADLVANAPVIHQGDIWVDRKAMLGDVKRVSERADSDQIKMSAIHADAAGLAFDFYGDEVFADEQGNPASFQVPKWTWQNSISRAEFSRVRFEPALQVFSFPIFEGKHWQSNFKWESRWARGRGLLAAEARRWERVTVPAGTFRALRVDVYIEFTFQGNSTDAWPFEFTYWYSPEVNRYVKYEDAEGNSVQLAAYFPAH